MTVHRNRFLVNKTNRCTGFQFYWYYDSTCFGQPFCPSLGVLSLTSALVHFMQLWWPFATRSRIERSFREFCRKWRLPPHFWVFLHAINLRHGTDGFTSPPKEGVLRIFSPEKSGGFGRVWTRELGYQRPACLPLEHRSRYIFHSMHYNSISFILTTKCTQLSVIRCTIIFLKQWTPTLFEHYWSIIRLYINCCLKNVL